VKILVDMNLSPQWVTFLVGEGFLARHWSTVGDPRAADRELLEWARAEGYLVFTNDLDFGFLLATAGAAGPSVFQVRVLDLTPKGVGRDVVRVLRDHAEALSRGAIVTLDSTMARVRVLPIQQARSPV
jgi:predicted nuclease of predicted toxin-antitoxin system